MHTGKFKLIHTAIDAPVRVGYHVDNPTGSAAPEFLRQEVRKVEMAEIVDAETPFVPVQGRLLRAHVSCTTINTGTIMV